MSSYTTRITVFICMLTMALAANGQITPQHTSKYVCPPCYHVDKFLDGAEHEHDGKCPVCGMALIEKPLFDINTAPELHSGSGSFYFQAQQQASSILIPVFYHKPTSFNHDTRILLVIPGAGRNAWSYRDAWIKASELHNVLVISPSYAEQSFDFAAYHFAGIVDSLEFTNFTTSSTDGRVNKYFMQDEDLKLGNPTSPENWLFNDFERLFVQVKTATGLTATHYDLFGHSAGGQILHRMAIYNPRSSADRIIAANSGSYTLPNFAHNYPFALGRSQFNPEFFPDVFSTKLTLLIGEQDNDQETRGTLLHSPITDKRGLGRLARGQYFFKAAQQQAFDMDLPFNWQMKIVPNVGHDYENMSIAAAELLYGAGATSKQ
ncbi:hypothetical protein QX776_02735 [Alteromonadaceae bacterium BrNp21-10]|nr:hypothetical protein [Alteromonadaceae bacterium BrNp21-10]